MNSLVLLYGIVDFYGRHLESSGIIKIENGNVRVIVDYWKLSKVDRKIFDDFFKILRYLSRLDERVFNTIKEKWFRVVKSFEGYKELENGYGAVFVGLGLLEEYSKLRDKELNFHKNRVQKILSLMRQEARIENRPFRLLDEVVVRSFKWSDKLIKQLGA